jgi:hypothetical protein
MSERETKVRPDCYLNNGKKEGGKRVVLKLNWDWKACLNKVAGKFGEECGDDSLLYSEDGISIEEVDEVREGEMRDRILRVKGGSFCDAFERR